MLLIYKIDCLKIGWPYEACPLYNEYSCYFDRIKSFLPFCATFKVFLENKAVDGRYNKEFTLCIEELLLEVLQENTDHIIRIYNLLSVSQKMSLFRYSKNKTI